MRHGHLPPTSADMRRVPVLYSRDHFVEPAHKLGNIGEHRMIDLILLPQQQALGRAKRDTLPRSCLECDVRASGT
jgi:serine-type anaerobic sulfatase-maturating enzyme